MARCNALGLLGGRRGLVKGSWGLRVRASVSELSRSSLCDPAMDSHADGLADMPILQRSGALPRISSVAGFTVVC